MFHWQRTLGFGALLVALSLPSVSVSAQSTNNPSLWSATNQYGNPLPQSSYDGYSYNGYTMYAIQNGRPSNSYPFDQVAARYFGFFPLPNDPLTQPNNLDETWYHDFVGASCSADNDASSPYGTAVCYSPRPEVFEDIIGGSSVSLSGSLYAKFVYSTDNSAPPAPAYVDVLLTTNLMAESIAYYSNSGKTSGLSASTTVSIGSPFADQLLTQASSVAPGNSTSIDHKQQLFRHLLRVPVSAGVAEVSLPNITATLDTNNGLPWGQTISDPAEGAYYSQTNGPTSAGATAHIAAAARIDNREVTISCPTIEISHHKVGTSTTPVAWQRDPVTGAMNGDSVAVYSGGHWKISSSSYGDAFVANAPNFIDPYYTWSVSGAGATEAYTNQYLGVESNMYSSLPVQIDFGTASTGFPKSSTVRVDVRDNGLDNAVGANTYTVNWHLPHEWFKDSGYQEKTVKLSFFPDGNPTPGKKGGGGEYDVQHPQ